MGQKKHQADGTAELQPQGPRNQVVIAASFYLDVGGHGRQGNTGEHADGVGQSDDDQAPRQSGAAHHIPEPQK